MSKRTRAKKWANENPDAVVALGAAVMAVGFVLWIRHAIKNVETYPVAYGFDMMDDGKMLVHKFFEDGTLMTAKYTMNPPL